MWNLKIYRLKKHEQGFTFLEVIFAISIIGIVLTSLLVSQSQSLSLISEAKFNTTAPLLARGMIAEMEAAKIPENMSDSGDFGDDFPNYFWELKINDVSLPGIQLSTIKIKQIDVFVFWGESKQYQYNLRLYRFI